MKKLKIIFLSLGLASVSVLIICRLADLLFETDVAKFVVVFPALMIGMHARQIAEKILGYTLRDAMKEDSNG